MANNESYSRRLSSGIGTAWNQFWFTPRDTTGVALLRVLVGLMALYFVVSHTADLTRWFATDGLLPVKTVEFISGPALFGNFQTDDPHEFNGRFSIFLLTESAVQLWVLHGLATISCLMMILGFRSRLAAIITLMFVLSYVHRAPFLCSTFEPVLCFSLAYLCLAPVGSCISIDRRIRNKQDAAPAPKTTVAAGLATRLIQVHTVAIMATMALTMLGSEQLIVQSDEPMAIGGTWWHGDAVWDLINRSESRLVDLTWLGRYPLLIDASTHAIMLFQFAFIVLVWNSLTRQLMLILAIPFWVFLIALTGQLSFGLMMLIANLSFVNPSGIRRLIAGLVPTQDK